MRPRPPAQARKKDPQAKKKDPQAKKKDVQAKKKDPQAKKRDSTGNKKRLWQPCAGNQSTGKKKRHSRCTGKKKRHTGKNKRSAPPKTSHPSPLTGHAHMVPRWKLPAGVRAT